MENTEWQALTPEEKKRELYFRQKETLDKFLERGAISRAQYEKSLGDLTAKMGPEVTGVQADTDGRNSK